MADDPRAPLPAEFQKWAALHGPGLAPDDCLNRFLLWLPTATVEERHAVTNSWNWGFGIAPLQWIASRPDCAKATAAMIFFDGEPIDTEDESEACKMLSEIREKWPAYPDHDIGYAPPRYVSNIPDDQDLEAIPLAMRRVIPGCSISTDGYHEGIPFRFFQNA